MSRLHSQTLWLAEGCPRVEHWLRFDLPEPIEFHGLVVQGRKKMECYSSVNPLLYADASFDKGASWIPVDDGYPFRTGVKPFSDEEHRVVFSKPVKTNCLWIRASGHMGGRFGLLIKHTHTKELVTQLTQIDSTLFSSALPLILVPQRANLVLQMIESGGNKTLESVLGVLSNEVLNKDIPLESRHWTGFLLEKGCTELINKLMDSNLNDAHILREAMIAPELFYLTLTPEKAPLALRLLEQGAIIDEDMCLKVLSGGMSPTWSTL